MKVILILSGLPRPFRFADVCSKFLTDERTYCVWALDAITSKFTRNALVSKTDHYQSYINLLNIKIYLTSI